MKLRLEVQRFAEQMERVLRENDLKKGQSGWKSEDYPFLMRRLWQEIKELRDCRRKFGSPKFILHEATDIANFAMMIAHNFGDLLHGEKAATK